MEFNKKTLVLVLFLTLFGPAFLAAFDFSEIEDKVVEYKLDNGLTVLVLPRHDAPVASFVTQVNAGCADDPKDCMGMAHMFEHMAFKGTMEIGTEDYNKEKEWMDEEDRIFRLILEERFRGDLADSTLLAQLDEQMKAATDSASEYIITNEYTEILKRNGGVGLNAGTGYDNTTYYVSLPSNRLELWIAMEADRFLNPVLRDLFKEKQVVAEERRFRLESSPTGRMIYAEYPGLAFNSHPYGQPIIGEMNEIQNYNRDDMLEHFRSHYVPSNMAVAIVGDVEPDEVYRLAKKYFSPLEDNPKPPPVMVRDQTPYGIRQTTIHDEAQPMFLMGFHVPSELHPDFLALDVLSSYLGSGRTSVLYKRMVKEEKTAVQASAFIGFPGSKYPTLFSFMIVPSNESTNAENEKSVLEEIIKVRSELIPEKELEKIKAQTKANFINAMRSNAGLASQLVSYQNSTGDWHDLFRELDKVNALTPEDIKRVAEKYLDPEKRVVVYIEKPVEEEEPSN